MVTKQSKNKKPICALYCTKCAIELTSGHTTLREAEIIYTYCPTCGLEELAKFIKKMQRKKRG